MNYDTRTKALGTNAMKALEVLVYLADPDYGAAEQLSHEERTNATVVAAESVIKVLGVAYPNEVAGFDGKIFSGVGVVDHLPVHTGSA